MGLVEEMDDKQHMIRKIMMTWNLNVSDIIFHEVTSPTTVKRAIKNVTKQLSLSHHLHIELKAQYSSCFALTKIKVHSTMKICSHPNRCVTNIRVRKYLRWWLPFWFFWIYIMYAYIYMHYASGALIWLNKICSLYM